MNISLPLVALKLLISFQSLLKFFFSVTLDYLSLSQVSLGLCWLVYVCMWCMSWCTAAVMQSVCSLSSKLHIICVFLQRELWLSCIETVFWLVTSLLWNVLCCSASTQLLPPSGTEAYFPAFKPFIPLHLIMHILIDKCDYCNLINKEGGWSDAVRAGKLLMGKQLTFCSVRIILSAS